MQPAEVPHPNFPEFVASVFGAFDAPNWRPVALSPLWLADPGGRMLNVLRAITRFMAEKIGWHRFGIFMSLTIISVAGFVLYRKLQGLNVNKVLTAMSDVGAHDVALAALFVACGYLTLTCYDLFALRTLGRKEIPYRVAALAGFTSYSIGHNVGASVFTGGAVRYHIYSTWGLSAVEVAKLCFIAGLTFWLGNATVLGLGIAYEPESAAAVDRLPPWLNRGLAILVLLVLVSYVVWVWTAPRVIGRETWEVRLPGGKLTLLQIIIGVIDMAFCSLAMYMLMPNAPYIDFIAVAVIFVSATLLGFVSHSPGGLGVFDAGMLFALEQFDREELLAGLLMFRLLYYISPFTMSLFILGVRELALSIIRARKNRSPNT
jgi:glycosyltransferase 2 family protein